MVLRSSNESRPAKKSSIAALTSVRSITLSSSAVVHF